MHDLADDVIVQHRQLCPHLPLLPSLPGAGADNATESYQLLLNTLQTVGSIQPWTSAAAFSDTLEQIIPQQGSRWAGVLLTCQGKTIYSTGSAASALSPPQVLPVDDQSALTHLTDSQGKRYIQLSRAFSVGSDTVYLTAATDLTHLYDIRARQQTTFYRIFAVMVVICTLLSCTIAYLLTRSLGRLSQARSGDRRRALGLPGGAEHRGRDRSAGTGL